MKEAGGRRVNITDIWVDSEDSLHGGRDLWAIPKDLCEFRPTTTGNRVQRTSWSITRDGAPIASARFTDISRLTPRTPFKGSTWQQRGPQDSGPDRGVVAELKGSAKALSCRGSWDFDAQGPLGWLAGKRPLASLRMLDFSRRSGSPSRCC